MSGVASSKPERGELFGLDQTEDTGGPARSLIVVNVTTQTVVSTIPTVNLLHTLAFISLAPPEPIPVTGLVGLLVLVTFLAVAGFLVLRAR